MRSGHLTVDRDALCKGHLGVLIVQGWPPGLIPEHSLVWRVAILCERAILGGYCRSQSFFEALIALQTVFLHHGIEHISKEASMPLSSCQLPSGMSSGHLTRDAKLLQVKGEGPLEFSSLVCRDLSRDSVQGDPVSEEFLGDVSALLGLDHHRIVLDRPQVQH